jgi:hypothetical protein
MRRAAICYLGVLLCSVVSFCQVTTNGDTNSGLPRVVPSFKIWGHTGSIKPITLFTPKHFGVYRASGVFVVTADTEDPIYGTITCKDGAGAQQLQFSAQGGVGDTQVGPFTFRDLIGVPIRLSVSAPGYQTGKYNLFVVVEQIM